MLYSFISAVAPSKCFSQTNVSRRTRLLVRANSSDARMASSSARSASKLPIDDGKWISPGKTALAPGTHTHLDDLRQSMAGVYSKIPGNECVVRALDSKAVK